MLYGADKKMSRTEIKLVWPVVEYKLTYEINENIQGVLGELICLLPLHELTVNNIQCHHLHTKFHPNPPIGSKVAHTSEV
jgi:hypothetical protein